MQALPAGDARLVAMPTDMTLSINDLRSALELCLDECERQLGTHANLDADHYWSINIGDAFDLAKPPTVVAGQLADDLDSMVAARNASPDEPYLIWHEVTHLLGPLTWLAARSIHQSPGS